MKSFYKFSILTTGIIALTVGGMSAVESTKAKQEGAAMIKKADHVIYYVNDLNRAKKFYSETLGLPIKMEYPGFVGIDLGGLWLGLHPSEMKGADVGKGGFVYLSVDNLKNTVEDLRKKGVKILVEPSEVPTGKVATIHDSEGNALGLYEATAR